jgi:hypothetical protein
VEVLLVLAVAVVAVVVIAWPLRRGRRRAPERGPSAERAELEAARDAKYREIRDAELDLRTGKLSREDWRGLDATLRSEAIELLRRIDALEELDGADSR